MPNTIMVSSEGPVGHVAVVESVNENTKTFIVSEMNYKGFNQIDYRTINFNAKFIKGFIF